MLNVISGLSTLKKVGIISVIFISLFSFISYKLYTYHTEAIEVAVSNNTNELLLEQERLINEREAELLELSEIDKEQLENRIQTQSKQLRELEKQLLIDHDLDRLLQAKPGMILKIVNDGTKQFYKEVEEATK